MDYEKGRELVSKNITKYRLQAGLSKKEVAKKLKMDYYNYCKIENNKTHSPRFSTLLKIAEALDIKYEKIFEGCRD